jgi:hypothetical protein
MAYLNSGAASNRGPRRHFLPTLNRGTPNATDMPRALATIRRVRRWYADASREMEYVPRATWESLTPEQQAVMRFPVGV